MVRQPIERIAEQMREFQKAAAGARRAARLLATVPTLPEGRGDHLPPGPLPVDLDDVAFAYAGDTDVLVDLDLHLAPGTRLGVVGRTGSGKSTLGRLLARLWDVTDGSVRLGGVDVRDADTDDLRRRVAVVSQDVELLRASLRDNLTFLGTVAATDDDLRAALADVGLAEWAAGLDDGLDTMLDGGVGPLGRPGPAAGLRPRPARRSRAWCSSTRPPAASTPTPRPGSPRPPTGRSAAAPW